MLNEDETLCDGVFCRIADLYGNELDIGKESKYERVVTLIWHSMGIIGNGGFQYLFEGDFRGDPGFVFTVAALHKIGCEEAAAAFKEALAIFPGNSPPTDIKERLRVYQAVSEAVRKQIDRRFWKASEDIPRKLAAFIRENKSEFPN